MNYPKKSSTPFNGRSKTSMNFHQSLFRKLKNLVTPKMQSVSISELLPEDSSGFAVFDLETTGLSTQTARILEIAIISLDRDGYVQEEWETLVNPGESICNTFIHGITDQMVKFAPSFNDLASLVASKLNNRVLVAHNLSSYDQPILQRHLQEHLSSFAVDLGNGIDTMPSPRRKLEDMCDEYGVTIKKGEAHTAMGDTRALTKAFCCGLSHLQSVGTPVSFLNGLPSCQRIKVLKR